MQETILKIVVPAIAVLSLGLNFVQYLQKKKVSKFDAERELAKRNIEWERLEAKHKREKKALFANCEGEIKIRDNITTDTFTLDDNRRIGELGAEQRREYNELLTEITYFEKILGKKSLLLGEETLLERAKRLLKRLRL